MINPLEVLSYSQVSGTCPQSTFKACTKCCYETLTEILKEMAFPSLGTLTTAAQLTRVRRCLSPQVGSQCPWASPPVPCPCQPSGTAAAPCPVRGCLEPAEGQAQLPTKSWGQDWNRARDSSHSKTFPGLIIGLG